MTFSLFEWELIAQKCIMLLPIIVHESINITSSQVIKHFSMRGKCVAIFSVKFSHKFAPTLNTATILCEDDDHDGDHTHKSFAPYHHHHHYR